MKHEIIIRLIYCTSKKNLFGFTQWLKSIDWQIKHVWVHRRGCIAMVFDHWEVLLKAKNIV